MVKPKKSPCFKSTSWPPAGAGWHFGCGGGSCACVWVSYGELAPPTHQPGELPHTKAASGQHCFQPVWLSCTTCVVDMQNLHYVYFATMCLVDNVQLYNVHMPSPPHNTPWSKTLFNQPTPFQSTPTLRSVGTGPILLVESTDMWFVVDIDLEPTCGPAIWLPPTFGSFCRSLVTRRCHSSQSLIKTCDGEQTSRQASYVEDTVY